MKTCGVFQFTYLRHLLDMSRTSFNLEFVMAKTKAPEAPDVIDPDKIVVKDGQKYYPLGDKLVRLAMVDEDFDEERDRIRKDTEGSDTGMKRSKKRVADMISRK